MACCDPPFCLPEPPALADSILPLRIAPAATPSVAPRLAELEHRHERLLDELDGLNQRIEAALEGLGLDVE